MTLNANVLVFCTYTYVYSFVFSVITSGMKWPGETSYPVRKCIHTEYKIWVHVLFSPICIKHIYYYIKVIPLLILKSCSYTGSEWAQSIKNIMMSKFNAH